MIIRYKFKIIDNKIILNKREELITYGCIKEKFKTFYSNDDYYFNHNNIFFIRMIIKIQKIME